MATAEKTVFIAKAEEIAAEEPSYRRGGSGNDGTCDCIGLIIGSLERAGVDWQGIHGSNYAARNEMVDMLPVQSSSDLEVGEAVYKAYEPEHKKYDLPDKYKEGGKSYNGDVRDYYHVGIVESVYPIRIRHMTTPQPKMDVKIGSWSWHGKLKKVNYAGGGGGGSIMVTISGGNTEKPVNMRSGPSGKKPIIAKIPQGSVGEKLGERDGWTWIEWSNKQGWVMDKFIHDAGQDNDQDGSQADDQDGGQNNETVTINRAELEKVYDTIGDWLGLRG